MKKKVKLFRIEHFLDGNGPYRSDLTENEWRLRSHDHLPNPMVENIIDIDDLENKYKCAFISKKSLKRWFNKSEIKRLKKEGFEIYSFKVDECKIKKGSHQVLFPSKVKRDELTVISLKDLYGK